MTEGDRETDDEIKGEGREGGRGKKGGINECNRKGSGRGDERHFPNGNGVGPVEREHLVLFPGPNADKL